MLVISGCFNKNIYNSFIHRVCRWTFVYVSSHQLALLQGFLILPILKSVQYLFLFYRVQHSCTKYIKPTGSLHKNNEVVEMCFTAEQLCSWKIYILSQLYDIAFCI